MPDILHITPALSMSQGAKSPTLQKSSQTFSTNLSSKFFFFVFTVRPNKNHAVDHLTHVITQNYCFSSLSNPACTDIMEIYNAVEEMDDDDEVRLP